MSEFKFTNLIKTKGNFVISKLPTHKNVPTVKLTNKLEGISNEYNKSIPLCLIIVITHGATLLAHPCCFYTFDGNVQENVLS